MNMNMIYTYVRVLCKYQSYFSKIWIIPLFLLVEVCVQDI